MYRISVLQYLVMISGDQKTRLNDKWLLSFTVPFQFSWIQIQQLKLVTGLSDSHGGTASGKTPPMKQRSPHQPAAVVCAHGAWPRLPTALGFSEHGQLSRNLRSAPLPTAAPRVFIMAGRSGTTHALCSRSAPVCYSVAGRGGTGVLGSQAAKECASASV